MRTIVIHTPIWSNNSIGIRTDKIDSDLRIEIDYKTKCGQRLYPEPFFLGQSKARSYPLKMFRNMPGLFRIIPINELEITQ
jgi:hypothetical protein